MPCERDGRVPCGGDTRRGSLLYDVAQLVREQAASGVCVRRVFSLSEVDLAPCGESRRAKTFGGCDSVSVGAYADAGEIVAESRLKVLTQSERHLAAVCVRRRGVRVCARITDSMVCNLVRAPLVLMSRSYGRSFKSTRLRGAARASPAAGASMM
jgi:hypothetical protein